MLEAFSTWFKTVSIIVKMSRHDHYKLKLICDDLNDNVDCEYEITPEIIAAKVLKTFVDDMYEDSAKKAARRLLPELQMEASDSKGR